MSCKGNNVVDATKKNERTENNKRKKRGGKTAATLSKHSGSIIAMEFHQNETLSEFRLGENGTERTSERLAFATRKPFFRAVFSPFKYLMLI